MGRREELEREILIAKDRLDNAPSDTPEEVFKQWRREYDSLSFELNNLFDDYDADQ